MKLIKLGMLIASLCVVASQVHSNEVLPGQNENGCGTAGIQGILVPDSTLLTRCKFHEACDVHDICYGKCLEGGEHYGKEICNDPIATEARRAACDVNFLNDIIANNNDRSVCKFYGKIYRFAVVKFGKGNFDGREIEEFADATFELGENDIKSIYENLIELQKAELNPLIQFDQNESKLLLRQSPIQLDRLQEQLDLNVNEVLRSP